LFIAKFECSIIVFVCILPEKAVPEMTYTVSGATLNPTHSLTNSLIYYDSRVLTETNIKDFLILALIIFSQPY